MKYQADYKTMMEEKKEIFDQYEYIKNKRIGLGKDPDIRTQQVRLSQIQKIEKKLEEFRRRKRLISMIDFASVSKGKKQFAPI